MVQCIIKIQFKLRTLRCQMAKLCLQSWRRARMGLSHASAIVTSFEIEISKVALFFKWLEAC